MNARLFLYLFRNQYQLTTEDAIYSDGDRYEPAIAASEHLKAFLPSVKDVLMLGVGIGSLIRVLHTKGYNPRFTIVEQDKVVLQWAMELFDGRGNIVPVCNDALVYMERCTEKFDLLFIDIFDSRVVPEFVTTERFLGLCNNCLAPGGHLVLNYIINYKPHWDKAKAVLTQLFPNHQQVELGLNRIIIV